MSHSKNERIENRECGLVTWPIPKPKRLWWKPEQGNKEDASWRYSASLHSSNTTGRISWIHTRVGYLLLQEWGAVHGYSESLHIYHYSWQYFLHAYESTVSLKRTEVQYSVVVQHQQSTAGRSRVVGRSPPESKREKKIDLACNIERSCVL